MALNVVIHAPTPEALSRARSNAKNLLAAAPQARVEIVANASAVQAAIETRDAMTDDALRLCENTMRNNDLEAPLGIATVKAAILHLVERQAEGWAYVRA